jgi:hypothetical protein
MDELGRIEEARLHAWAGLPYAEIKVYWDAARGDFAFPPGWPEGDHPNGLDPAEPGKTWLDGMLR